ncbi:MAG TPA: hypothetical protein VJ966_09560, partial [Actinomycetes bacterium]|nr:hypothetical protein [Actinomycetes bacterium]
MADWVTISSLATAGGTLVLAVATFASVRSANRAARTAERALQVGLRPLLVPSRLEDPLIKVLWVDGHYSRLEGGRAAVEVKDGVIYLALSLRNVGSGMAVLHGWHPWPEQVRGTEPHADPARFRTQTRDLYVPPGDVGFWQGAFRDRDEPGYAEMCEAVQAHRQVTVDLLYGDHEGGQRMVSRFAL